MSCWRWLRGPRAVRRAPIDVPSAALLHDLLEQEKYKRKNAEEHARVAAVRWSDEKQRADKMVPELAALRMRVAHLERKLAAKGPE